MGKPYRRLAVQAYLGWVRFRLVNLVVGLLVLSLLPLVLHLVGVR